MERSVFDVSADILQISGQDTIPAISLQKIVYYAFGWYGRLTGQHLFKQPFYAMQHGPVVGELLTLHAGHVEVSRDLIEAGRSALEDGPRDADPYYEQIVQAVWKTYGHIDRWALVKLTHLEETWQQPWQSRPEGSRRADIEADAILSLFSTRPDIPEQLVKLLPDPTVVVLSTDEMHLLECLPEDPFMPAAEKFSRLTHA